VGATGSGVGVGSPGVGLPGVDRSVAEGPAPLAVAMGPGAETEGAGGSVVAVAATLDTDADGLAWGAGEAEGAEDAQDAVTSTVASR
jgi:hypothetical protein